MSGYPDRRLVEYEVNGSPVEIEMPVDTHDIIWYRGERQATGHFEYVDPLVIRVLLDVVEGVLVARRVDAFGARYRFGALPDMGESTPIVSDDPTPTELWRQTRPLSSADLANVAQLSAPERLGWILAAYCSRDTEERLPLSGARVAAFSTWAGSSRARITNEDLELVAEAVRSRPKGMTPAYAVQSIRDRQWGRSRSYELVKQAIAAGYLVDADLN